jgi:tRNA threonylcarbamoyladenosine biosynthesis protein TsaB
MLQSPAPGKDIMRVLALETSGITGSVAALERGLVLAEQPLPEGQRSAQSLVPTIDALLSRLGWQLDEALLVTVTTGPGSFTSLRIGVSTAKCLAYAVGAPVLGVNTLEVIARQAPAEHRTVKAVLDAQRDQLFVATLERDSAGRVQAGWQTTVIDNQAWLAGLQPGDVVSGPGLKRLAERLPHGAIVIDRPLSFPTAAMVGQLGYEQFTAGRRDDVFQLVPHYFRRTAAEEQWERRQQQAP